MSVLFRSNLSLRLLGNPHAPLRILKLNGLKQQTDSVSVVEARFEIRVYLLIPWAMVNEVINKVSIVLATDSDIVDFEYSKDAKQFLSIVKFDLRVDYVHDVSAIQLGRGARFARERSPIAQ